MRNNSKKYTNNYIRSKPQKIGCEWKKKRVEGKQVTKAESEQDEKTRKSEKIARNTLSTTADQNRKKDRI